MIHQKEKTRLSFWKIKLQENFQNNKLLNVKVNISEWLTPLATQVIKLNKLKHPINDDYLMMHILASLPQEYSSVVDHDETDWRSKTLMLTELKKRLKEKYMQLQKEKRWGEGKMALSVRQSHMKNQSKGSSPQKPSTFKGRCSHCGKWAHKKCREWLKLTHEEQDLRSLCSIFDATIVIRWDIARDCTEKKV